MAELFLAVHTTIEGFSKVVALKRVLPHLARSQANIDLFLEEARLAAKLDHPHIVRIYELGEVSGCYFISMEYLPGEDLVQVLARCAQIQRPVPIDVALAIVRDVSLGLDYAHQLRSGGSGLVHRDVSPSNIILSYQAAAKIVDFGLAKAVTAEKRTRSGIVRGKLAYFAPEQLRKNTVDRRTDIFSLGLVLFELVAGRPAFSGENEAEILTAAAKGEVRPVTSDRPDAPPELQLILDKALAFNPDDRYPTALAFHDALIGLANLRGTNLSGAMLTAWLTELFGRERAELKLAISQGRDLFKNAPELIRQTLKERSEEVVESSPAPARDERPPARVEFATGPEGRTLISDSADLAEPLETPRSGSLFAGLIVAACAAVALAVIQLSDEPATAEARESLLASLSVDSNPPGADVFLGDQPIGKKTPANISGLDPRGPLALTLKKRGFAPARESLVLQPGENARKSYVLTPTAAFLKIVDVPAGAVVLVDGVRVAANERLEVAPGAHELRVERKRKIVAQRSLGLAPGQEQEVSLR